MRLDPPGVKCGPPIVAIDSDIRALNLDDGVFGIWPGDSSALVERLRVEGVVGGASSGDFQD